MQGTQLCWIEHSLCWEPNDEPVTQNVMTKVDKRMTIRWLFYHSITLPSTPLLGTFVCGSSVFSTVLYSWCLCARHSSCFLHPSSGKGNNHTITAFFLQALAGLGQVFFGVGRLTHLFREHCTQTTAVRRINSDIRPPLGNVMRRVLCHAAGQSVVKVTEKQPKSVRNIVWWDCQIFIFFLIAERTLASTTSCGGWCRCLRSHPFGKNRHGWSWCAWCCGNQRGS